MNIVVIISDTFRRDHVGCYGNKVMQTPVLDSLAEESVVFDRAYCASFPTLLCRAEMMTGKFVFPYLDWGPLPQNEVLLSSTLDQAGYTCTMVTDNLPLCRPGYGFDRGFHSRLRIRGQWYDNFQPKDREYTLPCPAHKIRVGGGVGERLKQYLRNISIRQEEKDWFTPQVINQAVNWLERYHSQGKFFLYIDLFDPHQPWDPPQEYVDIYDRDGTGDNVFWPPSPRADDMLPEDLQRMRAMYCGEISLVDRWVGKLLKALDDLGRREDTIIVFLSDHGIYLGERGLLGKTSGKGKTFKGWPTYCEVARVPMLFRVPGIAPGRRNAYVHPGDVAPTVLDLAGVKIPSTMRTSSLAPILRGKAESVRSTAVSSLSLKGISPHRPSVVRTDEWAMVVRRTGVAPELYHLPSDPDERHDVYATNKSVAREMHKRYIDFLRDNETPSNNLLPRLWQVSFGKTTRESLLMSDSEGEE